MRVLAFLCLSFAACAPASGASAPASSNACWPVVPLRLEGLEHGKEWEPQVLLDDDGSVHNPRGPAFARIDHDRAETTTGTMQCDADRSVHLGAKAGLRYDATDALVSNDIRIYVADDGEVEVKSGAKVLIGNGAGGRARIVGDVKLARRTAELLVLLSLAGPSH